MIARRGHTVLELLIAMTVGALVLAAAGAVLRQVASTLVLQHRVLQRERDQSAIWGVLSHQLRDAVGAEVLLASGDDLTYRHTVGEAPACAHAPATVTVSRDAWIGERLPDPARDRALVHDGRHDGGWHPRGIVSVSVANCPDGSPGIRVALSADVASAALLRVDEMLRLRQYQSGGADWIGLQSVSGGGVIQPLAGPVASGDFLLTRHGPSLTAALWAAQPWADTVLVPLSPPP
jgi:hypothetical protein